VLRVALFLAGAGVLALAALMSLRPVPSPAGTREEFWDRSVALSLVMCGVGSSICAATMAKSTFGKRLGILFPLSLLLCALVRVLTFTVFDY